MIKTLLVDILSCLRLIFIKFTSKCKECFDGEFYPYYGLAPHKHNLELNGTFIGSTEFTKEDKANFQPDQECDTMGVYFCPNPKCKNHINNQNKEVV